jgi:AraC-like DNA-binding protein
MQPVPLFRGGALRPLLDFLERTDRAHATAIFGDARSPLRDARSVLPLALGGRAYGRAADVLGASDLGLRIGGATQIERIGGLGELLRTSSTLGSALHAAVRFGPRFNTGLRYWLTPRGDDVWLQMRLAGALDVGREQVADFMLMIALRLVRLAAGPDWRPAELYFEGPPPPHAEVRAALAGSTRFDARFLTVVIPRRLLALPLPEPPRALLGSNEREWVLPPVDTVLSLRQTVEALVRLGSANVAAAAEAAGTSVRTFQRRLAAAGVGFGTLLAQARYAAACRMLVEPGCRVIDVSNALGYRDSANFTRAFRRWTGLSPREFRRARVEPDRLRA